MCGRVGKGCVEDLMVCFFILFFLRFVWFFFFCRYAKMAVFTGVAAAVSTRIGKVCVGEREGGWGHAHVYTHRHVLASRKRL